MKGAIRWRSPTDGQRETPKEAARQTAEAGHEGRHRPLKNRGLAVRKDSAHRLDVVRFAHLFLGSDSAVDAQPVSTQQ